MKELTKKNAICTSLGMVGYCSETKKYCNELLERGE